MFLFHVAFSLGLLSVVAGAGLYIWAVRHTGAGTGLAKILGGLVLIISILSVVCTGYYNWRFWHEGYFQGLMGMHGLQNQAMMNGAVEKHAKRMHRAE